MYNLLLALAAGLVVGVLGSLAFNWVAGVVPALFVAVLAAFLLSRRTGQLVQADVARVVPLLQERKVDEARALLEKVKQDHGRWQILLAGQIDAQIGMIDYLQLKFDDARPRLEAGKWRNAMALTALGAIHWRQGRKDEAWKAFDAAARASPNEVATYCVWATLLVRDGLRKEALAALARGLSSVPGNAVLKDLQAKVANDKKIDTKAFGEVWFQYFPEDLAKEMVMRGRRGPGPGPTREIVQPRFGARHAPRR